MSVRYENECCDCATPSYPCIGEMCSRRRVAHYDCDKCGTETTLYNYNGQELCAECIIESLEQVEGSGD